jgi:hypothetical protein
MFGHLRKILSWALLIILVFYFWLIGVDVLDTMRIVLDVFSRDRWYILSTAHTMTGISLVIYDFAQTPLNQKPYVFKQNYKFAFALWFLWPISVALELIWVRRARVSWGAIVKYVLHVLALFLTVLWLVSWIFFGFHNITDSRVAKILITFIAVYWLIPKIVFITMPAPLHWRRENEIL